MKKVAILQSNYIPWKGYFDIIASVDEFILYDDMQFTRTHWRQRNKIKTIQGVQWISIPVGEHVHRRIRDVSITDMKWQSNHWKRLLHSYKKSKFFDEIASWLEPLYLNNVYATLSEVNRCFIEEICAYLKISTKISNSWDYNLIDGKTERLADLCAQAGGTEYISGPAAKDYIDPDIFVSKNIKLTWFDYSGYPEYPQMHGEFVHEVSILDLLFNCGKNSPAYMKYA